MDNLELLGSINRELNAGRPVCRAVIVDSQGSAPRGKGARMIVLQNGDIKGTIGGGVLEAGVRERALEVLRTGQYQVMPYEMAGGEAVQEGMICGGRVSVLMEPLLPDDAEARNVYAAAEALTRRGGRGMLVTFHRREPSSQAPALRLLAVEGGQPVGSNRLLKSLAEKLGERFDILCGECAADNSLLFEDKSDESCFLWEAIQAKPTVILMGAGHVSQALAVLLPGLGFEVVAVDDRPEFANRERFPMARTLVVDGFDSAMEGLDSGPHVFVIIMTRGHSHDQKVLAQALEKDLGYLGMIGSKRKTTTIFNNLKGLGFSEQRMSRVHSPIGLDIGAQTPEEIAVSIAAELISVRAGKRAEDGRKAPSMKLKITAA